MLQITRQTEYAIRGLQELARRDSEAPVQLKSIAGACEVSEAFLAKIRAVPGVKAVTARIAFGGMVNANDTSAVAMLSAIDPKIAFHLEIDAKYDVYLKRQSADVEAFRRDENLVLTGVEFEDVPGLSNEARAKLRAHQPRTVGQAGRIDGMTPAALGILAAYLRRQSRRKIVQTTA